MRRDELDDLIRDATWRILSVNGMECPCCERGRMTHVEAQEHVKTCDDLRELAKEQRVFG